MIYKLITDKDLDVGMKKYFRDQLIETNTHILITCEGTAFSLICAKLGNRYDLQKLFPGIKAWSATTAYLTDEYCYKSDKVWKATQAGSGRDPDTEPLYWIEEDPRDHMLITFCVYITIFFLCKSGAPNKMTEEVANDYTSAVEWLDDCSTGVANPDWPLLTSGTSDIQWGSNPKLDHYY